MNNECPIALVFGAAGGIGAACVSRLVQQGYHTILSDIDTDRMAAVVAMYDLDESSVECFGVDITDAAAVEEFAEKLSSEKRTPTALINAAGILQDIVPLESLSVEDHDRVWKTNYFGTYYCSRAFGLRMAKRGGGVIVNVSSINSVRSTPLLAYAPGKAAIDSLTACMAAELGPSGVRVNAVAPGFTLTPILHDKIRLGLRDVSRLRGATCLNKLVEPADIADGIEFLCSDSARMITGITLPIDAGWLAGATWYTFGGVRHED